MSMLLKSRKFPRIQYQQKVVIWDSRQEQDENEIVYLRKNLLENSHEQLLKRARAQNSVVLEEQELSFADLLQKHYQLDFEKMLFVGVTGTNGKTTCSSMMRHLLLLQNLSVLEIGTLGAAIWKNNDLNSWQEHVETGYTTPDLPTLYDLLNQALQKSIDAVVMEVTSHAISLGRVGDIPFDGKLFTNLTQDHLDYHLNMENYKNVKKSWVVSGSSQFLATLNGAEPVSEEFFQSMSPLAQATAPNYSKEVSRARLSTEGSQITIGDRNYQNLRLHTSYNLENALLSTELISRLLQKPFEELLALFSSYPGVSGRMEIICVEKSCKKLSFAIDYAHTPDALEKSLLASRELLEKSDAKLWCVFGCGGNRDEGKRPLMGAVAQLHSDFVMLTSDNPRDEDPKLIISQIKKGMRSGESFENIFLEEDRKKAILFVAENMRDGDLCLIAGKGHESFQIIKGQKLPFSDSALVRSMN